MAVALGYSNPQKAVRDHVSAKHRTANESFTVNGTAVLLINESGLYSLIMKSKTEKAERFQEWVTSEVLPSIRKTGGYVKDGSKFVESCMSDENDDVKAAWDVILRQYAKRHEKSGCQSDLEIENMRLSAEVENLKKEVQHLKSNAIEFRNGETASETMAKSSLVDAVSDSGVTFSASNIAQSYNRNGAWLNKKLCELGVIYRNEYYDCWELAESLKGKGVAKYSICERADGEGIAHYLRWTIVGWGVIHSLLKRNGVLTMSELNMSNT